MGRAVHLYSVPPFRCSEYCLPSEFGVGLGGGTAIAPPVRTDGTGPTEGREGKGGVSPNVQQAFYSVAKNALKKTAVEEGRGAAGKGPRTLGGGDGPVPRRVSPCVFRA